MDLKTQLTLTETEIDNTTTPLTERDKVPIAGEKLADELKLMWSELHVSNKGINEYRKLVQINTKKSVVPKHDHEGGSSSDEDNEDEDVISVKDNSLSHLSLLNWILLSRYSWRYPNLSMTLRIILTYPLSVASADRSFSKLKLIKNYMRSTMGQDRLNGLALISIEKELAARVQDAAVIEWFWAVKERRLSLIRPGINSTVIVFYDVPLRRLCFPK